MGIRTPIRGIGLVILFFLVARDLVFGRDDQAHALVAFTTGIDPLGIETVFHLVGPFKGIALMLDKGVAGQDQAAGLDIVDQIAGA